jgi:acyl carrier protein
VSDNTDANLYAALAALMQRDAVELSPDTLLVEELGLDSMSVLELLMDLEERLGIEIDSDRLEPEHLATIGGLACFLAECAATPA